MEDLQLRGLYLTATWGALKMIPVLRQYLRPTQSQLLEMGCTLWDFTAKFAELF